MHTHILVYWHAESPFTDSMLLTLKTSAFGNIFSLKVLVFIGSETNDNYTEYQYYIVQKYKNIQ